MDDREKLFNDNIKLSYFVANKYKNSKMEYEDLVQVAKMGLWKAAQTYDPSRTKFSTYATYVMNIEVLYALRKYKHAQDTLSLDQCYDNDLSLGDLIESEDEDVQDTIEKDDLFDRVISIINELPDMYQKCLVLYYIYEYNQNDISIMMNMSQANVSRVIKKAINKVRNAYHDKYGEINENTSKLYRLRNYTRKR